MNQTDAQTESCASDGPEHDSLGRHQSAEGQVDEVDRQIGNDGKPVFVHAGEIGRMAGDIEPGCVVREVDDRRIGDSQDRKGRKDAQRCIDPAVDLPQSHFLPRTLMPRRAGAGRAIIR